jgi:hypothetical protein
LTCDTSVIIKILSCGTVEEKLFISDDLYIESKSKPEKYRHQGTPKNGIWGRWTKDRIGCPQSGEYATTMQMNHNEKVMLHRWGIVQAAIRKNHGYLKTV